MSWLPSALGARVALVVRLVPCLLAAACAGGAPERGPGPAQAGAAARGAAVGPVLEVRATARRGHWTFRYPGADGRLDTPDDAVSADVLHLPARQRAAIQLRSEDEVYVLGSPTLGLRQVAVPDLDYRLELTTGAPAIHELAGDPLCGRSHPDLAARLVVQPLAEYVAWLAGLARVGGPAVHAPPS
jgi:heme/copper-type cytochrome/quinol oxidase subunit 2